MKITCHKELGEALKYASSIEDTSLIKCLANLRKWETNPEIPNKVTLYSDFSPYSFKFVVFREDTNRLVLCGGLLYHGDIDETFSIQINPTKGWEIHT